MNAQAMGKKIDEFDGRKKEVYKTYLNLNTSNKHKMDPIPVCMIPKKLK